MPAAGLLLSGSGGGWLASSPRTHCASKALFEVVSQSKCAGLFVFVPTKGVLDFPDEIRSAGGLAGSAEKE